MRPAERLSQQVVLICGLVGMLAGCATVDPNEHANAMASSAGLRHELIDTGSFVLTAFTRIPRADQPIRIYIEGDGQAWLSRTQPALNPTPRKAIGLALAVADPAPNVAYLARPCQFTPMPLNPRCEAAWWASKRYAPEVIAALDTAISQLAAQAPGQYIELVGYSGGGALAVLLAARRSDIATIRTVAGNLDSEYVNQLHQVSPMPESANAMDMVTKVAAIPQYHFSGRDDQVIPPGVALRFVAAAGPNCARALTLPGLSHDGNWQAQWPVLLAFTPRCTYSTAEH